MELPAKSEPALHCVQLGKNQGISDYACRQTTQSPANHLPRRPWPPTAEEDAQKITLDVFRFITSSNLKILTAPLIRELVSYTLSKHGFEIARLKNTRIGFPYKDLEEKIAECHDEEELKEFIYTGVVYEFKEVKKLIEGSNDSN